MATSNMASFQVHVLRAVALLYSKFPQPVTIDHSSLLRQKVNADQSVELELEDGTEAGTIIWLHRNRVVDGNLLRSDPLNAAPSAAITDAQLTASALRVLRKTDSNAGGILGEAAVVAIDGPGEVVLGELLVRRLTGE